MVFALPAASVPPTRVTRTSRMDGTPRWASSMAGTVVTRSSSMMRGLVSAISARTTTAAGRRPPGAAPAGPRPNVHAAPAESAITLCTPDPFLLFCSRRSKSVEQQPEQYRHHCQVVPDGGESAQRRLEPPYRVGLSVRGRLFDERHGRDVPGPGEQHLQPDQHRELDDQENRIEAGEDARVP